MTLDKKAESAPSATKKNEAIEHEASPAPWKKASTSMTEESQTDAEESLNEKDRRGLCLKDSKQAALVILLVICLISAGAGSAYLLDRDAQARAEEEERAQSAIPTAPVNLPTETLVDNPIDLAPWQERNPDIYAWISYPGTAINHPILQNAEDMNHYLQRDMDGSYSDYGELYTQCLNRKDFEDPVTVIYGHTFPNTNVMFSDLHYLDDPTFMEQNPYIYVYLPKKILAYEVISVAETDNQLILSQHDFSSPDGVGAYFDSILHPSWEWAYAKEGISLASDSDRVIRLSTCCIPSDPEKRYIVTAKLVNEQKTH